MKIIRISDTGELSKNAGEILSTFLKGQAIRPTLILLSGGSAFDILSFVELPHDCTHLTISVLDERCSADENGNNFLLLTKTEFYARAAQGGAGFIDTSISRGETPELLAIRMEESWRTWKKENPEGLVIATMGIGTDGHTAGIMPMPEDPKHFEELFENDARWTVGYDAGDKNSMPLRATATCSFLRNEVGAAIVYTIGESKRSALQKTLAETGSLTETPARIMREMKDVTVCTNIA